MTLHEIGFSHGTDKAHHKFNGESYLDVYANYFEPIRQSVSALLELGVYRGKSLCTWRDYFPNAKVCGIDIDPSVQADFGERVQIVTGSQIDPEAIVHSLPGLPIDIVVDDGSHLVDHMIASFELIWPRVKPGGFYVLEDLICSYDDMGPYKGLWPGQSHNPEDTNYNNDRSKLERFLMGIIEPMDRLRGEVRFVHFHPMQCFIKKV